MDILNCRALKEQAGEKLSSVCDHKKLALIHAAVTLGAGLLVSMLQMYLNGQIESTGGLAGLGTRSILETIQMVLQYAVNIALPFWEFGFIVIALHFARGEQTGVKDLLEGFRRFGPVLRLYCIELLIYIAVGMACAYGGSFLFILTPMSIPLQERFYAMAEAGQSFEQMLAAMQSIPMEELQSMIQPYLIIVGVVYGVLALFLFYRFRMAQYIIMDEPRAGGIMALILSSRMTKGRRMKLLRLDLSFWWFYVLAAISGVVMHADVLLRAVGITLPISADMAWLVSYALGCLIQVVAYWQFNSHLQTTYAAAYDALRQQPLEAPKPQPAPKNLPWEDTYQTPQ